jgi:threonyl-tRNA synthetase
MENQQMNEELTPEQLEARRDEMKQFYENSLPYLEAQAKYEKLLTEVEEARYKRATSVCINDGCYTTTNGR